MFFHVMLWRDMDGPDHHVEDLIALASRRLDFLERLSESALEKREMVDELGHSRSTVNRAVAELEDAGLVTATDGGHVTTLSGGLAAEMYRRVTSNATAIRAASEVLAPLSATSPIDLELVAEAEVERTDGPPPYRSLQRIRDAIGDADGVRAVVPTVANLETLRVCHSRVLEEGLTVEMIMSPALFERLTGQFPAQFREMVLDGGYAALTADLPGFTAFLVERNGAVTVAVVVYTEDTAIRGILLNEAPAAVRWAEALYARLRADATDRTDELRSLDVDTADPARGSGGTAKEASPSRGSRSGVRPGASADARPGGVPDRRSTVRSARAGRSDGPLGVELEADGFVWLSPTYFERREPAPPATCWRTGLDLVEVYAGYAIDREFSSDGDRRNLTDHLVERLLDGVDQAVVGPPGSGKSTVCKSAACRWYEADYGPVFYRESGYGRTFDSPAALGERLRRTDGHALVVVEDAVRAEANAVFGLMKEFSGDPGVTFLLDAREGEWQQSREFPVNAGLEAYRHEAVERFAMPPLDETECRRLVRHFEQTIEGTVDPPVEDLFQQIRTESEADAEEAGPSEMLLLLHRLSAYADPLAAYGSRIPTTLTQDIQRTYEDLQDVDAALALDVGVTVNLLNAVGVGVYPDLVHALAEEGQHGAIRDAFSLLEGRTVFPESGQDRGDSRRYRSIHESWSRLFLEHLFAVESERDARQRFGRCVSALLSLADDAVRRERIDWEFEGEAAYVEEIAIDPGEWADDLVYRIFALGREHPGIAPLFGKSDYSYIELPEACSPETTVRCTEWRGEMYLRAGDHELAAREFERLDDLVGETDGLDPDRARSMTALSLNKRGEIEMHQGDLETAEEYVIRGLESYRQLDDVRGEARSLLRLGIISWTRGEYGSAEDQLTRSLESYREVGDKRGESACLGNLAAIALRNGDLDTAEAYATRCFEVKRVLGAKLGEADSLLLLGKIELERDAYDMAAEYVTHSFEIAQEIGARRIEANDLLLLGDIARGKGESEEATEYLERSLEIWQEMGVDHGKAECLRALGNVARERRASGEAEEYLTRSLELVREVGDKREEVETLVDLGELAQSVDDDRLARERFEAACELGGDVGAEHAVLHSRERLIELCESMGDTDGAVTHCETALDLARRAGLDEEREAFENELDRLSGKEARRHNRG